MRRRAQLLIAACLLSACATTHAPPTATGEPTWGPLAPQTLGATRSANQRVRVAYADKEAGLDCVLNITPAEITIVGLLPSGPRVFTVTYDGQQVSADTSPGIPEGVRPEFLLDDVQLAFWPLAALEQALAGTDWSVIAPDALTRRLRRAGRLVAEVHYTQTDPWLGQLWLVNFERGYSLSVETRPLE